MKKSLCRTFVLLCLTFVGLLIACGNKTYKINYDLAGGAHVGAAVTEYNGKKEVTLGTASKDGYVFEGWFEGNNKVEKIAKGSKGDRNLVAKWKKSETPVTSYTITFNTNGGTLAQNAPTSYDGKTEVLLPTVTKDGFDFLGWFTSNDFSGTAVTKINANESGNKTFYANWKPQGGQEPTENTITFVLNGGEFVDGASVPSKYTPGAGTVLLPTEEDVTKENSTFVAWYDNPECTGTEVFFVGKSESGDKVFYAKWEQAEVKYSPRWALNRIGFKGTGQEIKIKVLPVSDFDPFDGGYNADDKNIRQAHQKLVEGAYNVKITYSAWDASAAWGPERVNFIKNNYVDGSFVKNSVYVVNITSQWIPTLVKANTLAPLYDTSSQKGLFKDVDYQQDKVINEALTANKKVYGFAPGSARPDNFLYYNVELAEKSGLADPAELWFRGQWTWDTFKNWVQTAQNNLASVANFKNVIDVGAAEFFIGAAAGQNLKLVTSKGICQFSNSKQAALFDEMISLYSSCWNAAHGTHDVTQQFLEGQTVFANGSLWFLKESTRFDPSVVKFTIGVVPFPTSNTNIMTPYTAPYTYMDTSGNYVEVTEPLKTFKGEDLVDDSGNKIYGLDLSQSTGFQIPYTGTSNYSLINFSETSNNITQTIVFNVLYDLIAGQGDDPNKVAKLTADQGYEVYLNKKLDNPLYAKVIMSVQDPKLSYYELMEVVSMTAGDGSHFGPNGFWPAASAILKSGTTAKSQLAELKPPYEAAVQQLGIS